MNTFTVYLSTGTNFPDALAGSAFQANGAPGYNGPILLVNPASGTLPNATAAEICRIQPDQIIALGGTGVVPDTLITQAKTAAASTDCNADYGLP